MAAPKKQSTGSRPINQPLDRARVDPEVRSIVGGSRGIVTSNPRSAVERPAAAQGHVDAAGVVSARPPARGSLEAFVHALVAAGHEVHIHAKPINQPRRRA